MINPETGKPIYEFRGTRPGEKTRTCVGCGVEYVPAVRNQKYCSKPCRLKHTYHHEKVVQYG